MMNKELRDRLCRGCANNYVCHTNNTRCTPFRKELLKLMNTKHEEATSEEGIINKLADLIYSNHPKEDIVELTIALRALRHP